MIDQNSLPQRIRFWWASLRLRMVVSLLAMLTLMWMAVGAWLWVDIRHELDELLDAHLTQAAALLVAYHAHEIRENPQPLDAPRLHDYAPKVAFQVWHEGRLVLRSENAPADRTLADLHANLDAHGFQTVKIDGVAWRVFGTNQVEPDVVVYVGEREGARSGILASGIGASLIPILVSFPLMAAFVFWTVFRGLAPLSTLGQALRHRKPSDLTPVGLYPADGEAREPASELRPLVDAINGLFDRIRSMVDQERRFTADAAHELRTPIAGIRAQIQVAMGEPSRVLRGQALQASLAGCDRAAATIAQLLTLARLEAAEAQPEIGPVDLAKIARACAVEILPVAEQKRQRLEVSGTETLMVMGNEALLAVLLRNLLDNAVRYSAEGSQILLELKAADRWAEWVVSDSGPGMSREDMARLGDRFFRVLGSGETGSGLGWSIIRKIASLHGAFLTVSRSTRLGGLEVRVRLPGMEPRLSS